MGFCIKELFKDINKSEIAFLNKALKQHCHEYVRAYGKRVLPGETYPSNEWPDELKTLSCALLTLHRRGKDPKQIIEEQIDYPAHKGWGFGVPNYNGDWESFAEGKLGFPLEFIDSDDVIPNLSDDDFFPELDSPELKKRNDFLDMLDEIK